MNRAAKFTLRFFALCLLFTALPVFSLDLDGFATAFDKGEDLFLQNKPGEALEYLQAAVAENPIHVQAYLYLGIAYQQLGRPDDAIAAYLRILPRAGNESARIAFNVGNVYYTAGNPDAAFQYFSQALALDPAMSSAWLNRANSLVRTGFPGEAISDYEQYLLLEPQSSQKEEIQMLIHAIREEEARIKLEAGTASRVEVDRRQRFLDQVSSSLQSEAEDSRGLSARASEMPDFLDF